MKKVVTIIISLALILSMAGCGNYKIVDTTWTFDRAIISLPDGTIVEGPVERWRDYDDGDQLQVKINGTSYLVHSANVVLISEE